MTLPENSLPDQITAKYDHGILHLTLPKKEVTVAEKTTQKVKVA
jgi:HSP20 family molecular chaperone IbpA